MGYCSICANLKSMAKGAKTIKEKDINKKLLHDHREVVEESGAIYVSND